MAVAGVALLGLLAAVPARAQSTDDTEKYIRVVQQKPFVKALRAEAEPFFVACLNERLASHLGVGATLRFHIDDEWSVGLDYIKYFGNLSQLATDIGNQYDVYPEKSLMDYYAGAHATWTPLTGKFLLFNGPVVFWDLYLLAGVGVTRTVNGGLRPSGDLGFGVRFAFLDFLSIDLEVRDFMFQDEFRHETEFMNNLAFIAGIGVFVPFSHEYVYPK
jgi:outer membrane beta-barrel protein